MMSSGSNEEMRTLLRVAAAVHTGKITEKQALDILVPPVINKRAQDHQERSLENRDANTKAPHRRNKHKERDTKASRRRNRTA